MRMRIRVKRVIAVAASAALVLAVLVSIPSTRSVLKHLMAPVINIFSFARSDISVVEPGIDPNNVQWSASSKPVYVENAADSVPSVVRVTLVPVFTDEATGEVASVSVKPLSAPQGHRIELGDITLVFSGDWGDSWFYRDGWFYYKEVLDPGQTTEKLHAGVTLTNDTPEMRTKYQNIKIEIEVFSESLQAEGAAPSQWNLSVDSSGNVTAS